MWIQLSSLIFWVQNTQYIILLQLGGALVKQENSKCKVKWVNILIFKEKKQKSLYSNPTILKISNKNLTQNGKEIKIWKIAPLDIKEITQKFKNSRFSNESNKFLHVIKTAQTMKSFPLFFSLSVSFTHTRKHTQTYRHKHIPLTQYRVTHKTSIHIHENTIHVTLPKIKTSCSTKTYFWKWK